MKISFTTVPENFRMDVGYGFAGFNMVRALQRLGHQVPFSDESAPVEISFCQPHWDVWSGTKAYRIQYTPWESSVLPEGWKEYFNCVDEVWTPSPIVANWYKEAGVVSPIKVYEHGIGHDWKPLRRSLNGPIKFLHHGEPAPRKGAQMAFQAFREVFGDSSEASLTIKSAGASTVREFDRDGSIVALPDDYPNISIVDKMIEVEDLITLYQEHDCLVYPGWGEGFGLIPLQAIGTGMPTICTSAWAPYSRLLLPELSLSSKVVESPWPVIHPGQMFEPSYDDLVRAYKHVANNYDRVAGTAYKNSFIAHKEYDWDYLTERAFRHVVEKFSG